MGCTVIANKHKVDDWMRKCLGEVYCCLNFAQKCIKNKTHCGWRGIRCVERDRLRGTRAGKQGSQSVGGGIRVVSTRSFGSSFGSSFAFVLIIFIRKCGERRTNAITAKSGPSRMGLQHVLLCTHIWVGLWPGFSLCSLRLSAQLRPAPRSVRG